MNRSFPKIRCIKQHIEAPAINDIESVFLKKIKEFGLDKEIKRDQTVGITGSSRGISEQNVLLKVLVNFLKNIGAKPFIFPAMGSHGGATAEGQAKILEGYGITEETMGCPIKSSMEVIEIGKIKGKHSVYVDKYAAAADKVIIFNKIKQHSKFSGEVESGLSKMSTIGLGKRKGAKQYHQLISRYSWPEIVREIREVVIQKLPIICGIGIIQNAYGNIAEIHILEPEKFASKESDLLRRYKKFSPKLPFKNIDLLIVDEMGKDIFGTGMDSNITGRKSGSDMKVRRLFVRDLTKKTHGNAQGIGLADFTTKHLIDQIDFEQTYLNALTAYRTDSPKLPVFLKNDREVLKTVFNMEALENFKEVGLVWIKNTLEIKKMLVSESFFEEVVQRDDLEFLGDSEEIQFDSAGFLLNSKRYWSSGKEKNI